MNPFHRKRVLTLEQLDSRIALNGDMQPFASVQFARVPPHDDVGRFEVRHSRFSIQDSTPAIQQKQLHFPPQRFEFIRFSLPHEMHAKAEGEAHSVQAVVLSIPSMQQTNKASPRPSPLIAESNKSNTRPELVIPSRAAESDNQIMSGAIANQTPERKSVNVIGTPGKSPAPITITSPSNTLVSLSASVQPQDITTRSISFAEKSIFAQNVTSNLSSGDLLPAKKNACTTPAVTGMLLFSMQGTQNKPNSNERMESSTRIGERLNAMDQAILAENTRLNRQMAGGSRRLPIPKGMIEIREVDDNSVGEQQAILFKASSSPFEIIQLVFGSNNMIHGSNARSIQDSEPGETSLQATREDSILALALGVLFALTLRQKQLANRLTQLPSSLSKRVRSRR